MKIEALFDEIEEDMNITQMNIQDKLYEVPKLHGKYLRLYFKYKTALIKKQQELDLLYTDKYKKYKNGPELLDKKEIQFYILSDKEYSELRFKITNLEHIVDILDRTVKKVNGLSFDCKNIVAYLQFISGN